jgi:hypothetical protein
MGPSHFHHRALATSILAVALGSASCVSYGSHLTAAALSQKQRELSLNADVLVIDRGLGPQVLPNPELGYRMGVQEGFDVGGRVNAGSAEVNARWQLARGSLDVALVPGVGFGFVPATNADSGLFNAHALGSLLVSQHPAPRWDIVAGLRGALTYAFPLTAFRGDAAGDNLYWLAGGVLGLRFPLGKTTLLFPEVNLLMPYDTSRELWSLPTLQGGVALVFE